MTAKELYLEALECSVNELPVFLDFACSGDPQLRVEVEEMLEGDEPPTPAAPTPAAPTPAAPTPGADELGNEEEVA